jgi:O-antigen/teichoic acid export membrane protein
LSIISRSIISISANLTKAFFSLLTGILLARGLGPEEYGVFAFFIGTFVSIRVVMEMGASGAFFTFISKNERAKNFFSYYIGWITLQFVLSVIFITIIAPDTWVEKIWEGESRERVIIAFVAIFFQQTIWNFIAQVGESQRLTARVQILNIVIAAFHLIFVFGMVWLEVITIERVYYFIAIEFLIASIVAYFILPICYADGAESLNSVAKEFKNYCLPLIPLLWIGGIMKFADIWLLQHYGGSYEQAYYAISTQFSNLILIATSSVIKIIWKELSEANGQNNNERVYKVYNHSVKILLVITTFAAAFLVFWASEIVEFTLGEEYHDSSIIMTLMFFLPIYQGLNQINMTTLYAIEMPYWQSVIGIGSNLFGFMIAYIMLVPSSGFIPGFDLGGVGLAIKMLLVAFLVSNIRMLVISRLKGWEYKIFYQFKVLVLFVSAGYISYLVVNLYLIDTFILYKMFLAGLLYLIFVWWIMRWFLSDVLSIFKPYLKIFK